MIEITMPCGCVIKFREANLEKADYRECRKHTISVGDFQRDVEIRAEVIRQAREIAKTQQK